MIRQLLAPLLGVSLGAHLLLLFAPLPEAPEIEAEAPEEEFVDLLSISSLPAPVAEPEPKLTSPEPAAAPPPAAPTAPNPAAAPPAATADRPPPVAAPPATTAPPEPAFVAPPEPVAALIPETEAIEILTRLTRGSGESDFDSTATSFPAIAYLMPRGISTWSPAEQACFFTQIDDTDYRLHPQAASLRYLTRNVQFIETQDIPRTFPSPQYQVSSVPGGYCDRPLFQVLRDGQPHLFISVAGIGVGAVGQQASGLVILWASDPRTG